ncbi:MAG: hypothetical protein KAH22_10875 [Thiotrichaceae bacterium]|nr:hypothetical protein [Thiotrichaceae bacterium]
MLYLASQMVLFLSIAVFLGLFVGWWFSRVRASNKTSPNEIVSDVDLVAIKHRLDNCFDENVVLRRDLKVSQDKLIRFDVDDDLSQQDSKVELNEKIKVLLDDLQVRDDTILVLEQTIEQQRS